MGQVTQTRFSSLLKRVMALKAVDPGQAVGPFIQPCTDVQDFDQPENRAIRGERLWGAGMQTSNVAANFSQINLINPVGSGKLLVLRRCTWAFNTPTAANQPGVVFIAIGFPTAITTQTITGGAQVKARDSRMIIPGALGSLGTSGFGTQTTGTLSSFWGSATYYETVPMAAAAFYLRIQVDRLETVLSPGFYIGINFASDTLPVATLNWGVHCEGYERTLDPQEVIVPP